MSDDRLSSNGPAGRRTTEGIERTARVVHEEMKRSNPNATYEQARRRVSDALERSDRKRG